MKKKLEKSIVLLLIILSLIGVLSLSASALSWEGSTGNGGGGIQDYDESMTFAVGSTAEHRTDGYRFSVVDRFGKTLVNSGYPSTIDIYTYDTVVTNPSYYHKFLTKYNKADLIRRINEGFETGSTSENCYLATDFNFASALPNVSTQLEAWQNDVNNLNPVLRALGFNDILALTNGMKIIIEPIYRVKIFGQWHAATATEIALIGRAQYGGDSTGDNTNDAWLNIHRYSNCFWPNYLYTPDGMGLWYDASEIPENELRSFNTIINSGYGVGIAYSAPLITYTINFNGNGATGGSTASMNMTYDVENVLNANGYTKTGYTFKNWNTKADGTGTAYADKASVKNLTSTDGAIIMLYAQWEPISYTVKYNGNGSTGGSTADSSHMYDEAKALTTNGFTKVGYTFKSWNTKADGTGTAYADKASVKNLTATSGGTVTLYAQWTPVSYTVEYDGNGSTGGSTASSTHTYDTAKNLTTNGFTKNGYAFIGWNTKADGTGTTYADKASVKNLTSTAGGTVTLYAQWKPISYTVKYDGNGATGGSTESTVHIIDASSKLRANGFVRTGYTFVGWNTKANGSGTSYSDQQNVMNLTSNAGGTVTLYAQWTPITYTVKYDGNGFTDGSTDESTHTYDAAKALSENGFKRTGYTFAGWNTKANGNGTAYSNKQSVTNLTSTAGGTVTLYAQWTPITYTVKYDGNGYTDGSTADSSHTYDVAKVLTSNGYTKTGYTFVGWNTKANGSGTAYSNKQSVANLTSTAGGTVTLYAQWTPVTYTVSYDGNGATSGSTDNSSHIYDITSALTDNDYERIGYIYAGWNTKADGSGTSYSDGQDVKNLSSVNGATVTLYAQWKPITYKIEYNGNGATAGETATSTHVYGTAKNLTTNGYKIIGKNFVGWNTKANGSGTSYSNGQSVKNLTSTQDDVITLYAMWENDEGPAIHASDRWFTLEEAQSGAITLTELLLTASAEDSNVGHYTDFAAGEGTFTIIDYSADEFRSFETTGSVTITYYAEDFVGNTATKTAKVYITDVDSVESLLPNGVKTLSKEIRFISDVYYLDREGNFLAESKGGFSTYSKWLVERDYVTALVRTLSNYKNESEWHRPPVYSIVLDAQKVNEMKSFIEVAGIGSSLTDFFDLFLD